MIRKRIPKFIRTLLLLSVVTLVLASCKKEVPAPEIPYVYVNFSIDPNSPMYDKLNVVNGWETLTGGYNGILIFRLGLEEFVAFERACPYDPKTEGAQVRVEEGGTTCICPICNSRYIMTDGTPISGPSHYSLKQYQTVYDGQMLFVSN